MSSSLVTLQRESLIRKQAFYFESEASKASASRRSEKCMPKMLTGRQKVMFVRAKQRYTAVKRNSARGRDLSCNLRLYEMHPVGRSSCQNSLAKCVECRQQ